jgi:hypothetical protein
MSWQALLLEPAVLAAIARTQSSLAGNQRKGASRVMMAMAYVLGGISALFLLAGSYLWLEHTYNAQTAALTIGAISLGISLISAGVAVGISRRRRAVVMAHQHDITKQLETFAKVIMAEVEEPAKAYPKTALVLAALLGYTAAGTLREGTDALLHPLAKLNGQYLHH